MSQETHIIDLRRSFVPQDPNSLASTYHDTGEEDSPEQRIPVVPYDMSNCMPTPQGYASYFGTTGHLNISTLVASGGTGNVDELFMIQTNMFENILIALCDDGIWRKNASSTGTWTHQITLAVPASGAHRNWTKCVIDNVIYTYRTNEAKAWKCSAATTYNFTEFTPNTLNMIGQLGIFKAGGRLGFWDSENSTAWSSLDNTADFAASQRTLAGASIFQDVVGRIVNVLQHGSGFIIYCTKSIVLVRRTPNAPSLFAGSAIFNNNGISYLHEVITGEPDTIHYAMTTNGFVAISDGQAKFEIPEVATFLKEKRDPVYLHMLNGRYLFFPFMNTYYINGITKFQTQVFPASTINFPAASYSVSTPTTITESVTRAIRSADTVHQGIYLYNNFGYTSEKQATVPGQIRVYEDHLNTIIPLATIEAWKATGIGGIGSPSYFSDKFTTEGAIPRITSGNEIFIPTGMVRVSNYTFQANMQVEPNEKDFYMKQDYLWMYENYFQSNWRDAIQGKQHDSYIIEGYNPMIGGLPNFPDQPPLSTYRTENIVINNFEFGPYVSLDFLSERNKWYGLADKSAWLQRSLAETITVNITETIIAEHPEYNDLQTGDWTYSDSASSGTTTGHLNYAAAKTSVQGKIAAFNPPATTLGEDPVFLTTYASTAFNPTPPPTLIMFFNIYLLSGDGSWTPWGGTNASMAFHGGISGATPADGIFPTERTVQSFSRPQLVYKTVDTCVYKELGFTKITGHAHYDLLGNYITDNATDESTDYGDICVGLPAKTPQAHFNGVPSPGSGQTGGFAVTPADVVINSVTYTYETTTVTFPGGTNFLQIGSIEPVYVTFKGAFVYDTHLKKWGKMVLDFKQLLDYYPINTVSGDAPIPYDTFLPKCAALSPDGLIYLFDSFPQSSFITFGKFGRYRKGFTNLEEIHVQNRTPVTGIVTAEGSLDGRSIEVGLSQNFSYTDKVKAASGFSLAARWFNVTVSGNYDLTNLEIRSSRKGKR